MTIKGGTSQACAACKYQRRRCSKECPLAPYFPADQPEKFQHAHRLFGVRNVLSILKQVEEGQKEDAMRSVIFESAIRAQFPVRGCKALVEIYSNQLQRALEELYSVKNEIEMCKFECQQRNIPIPGYTNQEYPLQFVNDNNQEFVVPNNIYDQQPNLMINEYPLQQELDVSYYEDMALETLVFDSFIFKNYTVWESYNIIMLCIVCCVVRNRLSKMHKYQIGHISRTD
ncbi:hypothetical protein UlMin_014839 [Ulmus minor]